MIIRTTKWLLAGAIGGIILGLLDGLALYLFAQTMFFSTQEMVRAILLSIASCGFFGALLGLLCAPISYAFASSPNKYGHWFLGGILTLLAASLLWMLTQGPQASQLPLRPLLVGLVATVVGFGASFAILFVAGQSRHSRRLVLGGLAIGGAIATFIVDLTFLVRLYLPFHIALSIVAWFLIAAPIRLIWKSSPKFQTKMTAWILLLCICATGVWALSTIRRTQNIRFVLGEKTAIASDIILTTKKLFPPNEDHILDEIPPLQKSIADNPPKDTTLKRPGASILFITVDAMRYDRITPSQPNPVAPTINELAKNGTVFERAYTALPHTSYAVASFLTGKYIKPLFEIPKVSADQETWPEIMRRFRYRTGGFFTRSVFFIDRAKFKPLENKGYGFGYLKMEYRFTADQKVNQAIEFLDKIKARKSPMFTWVHLFEPHEPYKPECTRFGTKDEQRYDCEIFTADQEIKRLIDYVEEFFPETIIVIAADHGEEFGDHGGKHHGTTLYDEQIRVPLIMRIPGVAHRIVKEPVNLVDILGTILSIVDIPVPPRVRSNNLSGLILGVDNDKKAAFSQLHDERMVVYDSHKLIWDKSADLVRLYDLKKDPKETISIADQSPKTVASLKQKIVLWEATHTKTELRPVTTDKGTLSWPVVVQKALGGDKSVAQDLPQFLTNDTPKVVRHKTAQLLYEMWTPKTIQVKLDGITDPVCLAWIWSAISTERPEEARKHLKKITTRLKPLSPPWVTAQLTRVKIGDKEAIASLMDIATSSIIAPATRVDAIYLLGKNNAHDAESALIELLRNYQLRLAAAKALARINSSIALNPISDALNKETFVSRRAELTDVIARIGGKKVMKDVALQLTLKKPIPNALSLLEKIESLKTTPTSVRNATAGNQATFVKGLTLKLNTKQADKLFVQLPQETASLVIRCNAKELKTLQHIAAHQQYEISLRDCIPKNNSIRISLQSSSIVPPSLLVVHQ